MRFIKKLFSRKLFGLAAIAMLLSMTMLSFQATTAPAAQAGSLCANGTYIGSLSGINPQNNPDYKVFTYQANGDYLQYYLSPNPNPNEVKVIMTTSSNITWWKGIELDSISSQKVLATNYTQDNRHVASISTNSTDRWQCVELSKAKLFGVHTPMYDLNLLDLQGKIVHIDWLKD
jgi:hypothetical protein